MAKKQKAKKAKKVAKPYFEWTVQKHLIEQATTKGILPTEWKVITDGETEISKVRKHDDKCEKCGHFKFEFFAKEAPKNGKDLKIVGCENCENFITLWLNERTHGNTTVHAYQIKQGITEYLGVKCVCGYRPLITASMNQEQVDNQAKHDCHAWRTRKNRF